MVFPVVMYGCESWTGKKAEHRRIDAFELWCWRRLLRVPLDCKEIQSVHPKGDQSWVFIGRTDVEAETPILWPPDVKCWLIWKDPDAGKDWRQERGWQRIRWLDGITDSVYMSTAQEPPWDSPLGCILRIWKKSDPENLRKQRLTFFLQQNLEPVQIEEIWKMASEWHTKL